MGGNAPNWGVGGGQGKMVKGVSSLQFQLSWLLCKTSWRQPLLGRPGLSLWEERRPEPLRAPRPDSLGGE